MTSLKRLSFLAIILADLSSCAPTERYTTWSCYFHTFEAMESGMVERSLLLAFAISKLSDNSTPPAFFELDDRNNLLGGAKIAAAFWDQSFNERPAFHAIFKDSRSGDQYDFISDMKPQEDPGSEGKHVLAAIFVKSRGPEAPPKFFGDCYLTERSERMRAELDLQVVRKSSAIINHSDGAKQ